MDFLHKVFLDNTLLEYFIVVAVILIAYILKTVISKLATSFVFRMGNAQWRGMTKEHFDDIIINPLERIFLVVVVILSVGSLKYPKILEFSIHSVSIETILQSIASAIIIICIVSLLLRFMDFVIAVIKHKSKGPASEHQLLYFFKDFIRVVIIIFSIAFILKFSFQLDIGNLLTGLSIVGAALALSARESLENLIASFIIFFDKPFETGDTVKIKEFVGVVERIGLRSTRIRTFDKSLVAVPNKQMVDNILDNWSKRHSAKNEIKIVLPANLSSEEIKKTIAGTKEILIKKQKIVSSSVFLQDITSGVGTIMANYFTPLSLSLPDNELLRENINLEIKEMQEANEIKPPDVEKVGDRTTL
ncbi:MAG: mechanosensitive ion channel domain-containing protein [Ginsengibacter sp.]